MNVVGIVFDHETPLPVLPAETVINGYKDIVDEAANFVYRFVDSAIPYQESYPAPVLEFNGKRSVFDVDKDFHFCDNGHCCHSVSCNLSVFLIEG